MKPETKELLTALTGVATRWGLAKPSVCSDYPIESAARLTKGVLEIDFLYGPPEFHVEFALRDKTASNQHAVGLGDLFGDTSIRQWCEAHSPRASITIVDNRRTITEQVNWYCHLLEETCGPLFTDPSSFMAKFRK
jgi:hypothetical protein